MIDRLGDVEEWVGRGPDRRARCAMQLQAFCTIRSKRQLMEWLGFDLLIRWVAGLSADKPAWNHSTFSKTRDRLLVSAPGGVSGISVQDWTVSMARRKTRASRRKRIAVSVR